MHSSLFSSSSTHVTEPGAASKHLPPQYWQRSGDCWVPGTPWQTNLTETPSSLGDHVPENQGRESERKTLAGNLRPPPACVYVDVHAHTYPFKSTHANTCTHMHTSQGWGKRKGKEISISLAPRYGKSLRRSRFQKCLILSPRWGAGRLARAPSSDREACLYIQFPSLTVSPCSAVKA